MNGGLRERTGYLRGALELKPVTCALEDLEPVLARHVRRRRLDSTPSERGILIAPQEKGGRGDAQLLRERPR